MFDWNKPFTRQLDIGTADVPRGELVIVVTKHFGNGETHIVRFGNALFLYMANGRYRHDRDSDMDLVNIPEKIVVERWVVVSKAGGVMDFCNRGVAVSNVNELMSRGINARIHHIREEF